MKKVKLRQSPWASDYLPLSALSFQSETIPLIFENLGQRHLLSEVYLILIPASPHAICPWQVSWTFLYSAISHTVCMLSCMSTCLYAELLVCMHVEGLPFRKRANFLEKSLTIEFFWQQGEVRRLKMQVIASGTTHLQRGHASSHRFHTKPLPGTLLQGFKGSFRFLPMFREALPIENLFFRTPWQVFNWRIADYKDLSDYIGRDNEGNGRSQRWKPDAVEIFFYL